jgi:hypothetical protein
MPCDLIATQRMGEATKILATWASNGRTTVFVAEGGCFFELQMARP